MNSGPEITAVAAFNDRQAFGVVQRLLYLGRRVPEDVSVVGSDNVPGATLLIPSSRPSTHPRARWAVPR